MERTSLFTILSIVILSLSPAISYEDPDEPPSPSDSELQQFNEYVVLADSKRCSQIGSDILSQGGNVVDSAIAALFCNGLAAAQSMGIGGGFIMNIYKDKKFYTLNAKEVAPLAATPNMFESSRDYETGPLSIGVPGEVKGYWELYKRFGSKPWKSLVEPTIKMCEEGVMITDHMYNYLENRFYNDKHLRKTFFKKSKKPHRVGSVVKFAQELCDTFKMIADKGGDDFYNGTLADLIAEDFKDIGSIITRKDLESYKSRWEETLSVPLNGNVLHVPQSAGGPLVGFIMNILRGYNMTEKSIQTEDELIRTYHRLIESYKFAFGYRTQLNDTDTPSPLVRKMLTPAFGDEIRAKINDHQTNADEKYYGGEFVSIDKGTSHMSILAPNGDAVSVTSSVNLNFGCGISGKRTGIIFNNGMNDFAISNMENSVATHPTRNNFIEPQKRAASSFSPTIVTDSKGDVRLVVGAAGGPKIITTVAMIIARILWFKQNVKIALDAPRMHHQLLPMEVDYQYGNPKKLISGLQSLGHKTYRMKYFASNVCAIERNQTGIFANADWRKPSEAIGI